MYISYMQVRVGRGRGGRDHVAGRRPQRQRHAAGGVRSFSFLFLLLLFILLPPTS